MPRKPQDSTPQGGSVHMDEETSRELYGGSGSHQGPGRIEGDEEGAPPRQTNSPSPSGSPRAPSHHQQST